MLTWERSFQRRGTGAESEGGEEHGGGGGLRESVDGVEIPGVERHLQATVKDWKEGVRWGQGPREH